MSVKRKGKQCECPRCMGCRHADPKWGYDRRKVADVKCFYCAKKIGRKPFREVITFARFGSISFAHAQCCVDRKTSTLGPVVMSYCEKIRVTRKATIKDLNQPTKAPYEG